MEEGYLSTKIDVGLLNFFSGWSLGSKASLKWSNKKGLLKSQSIENKKKYEGFRCSGCESILIKTMP